MDFNEFEKEFKKECEENNIKCSNVEKFYKYMKLVLDWNEKINLTSITDEKMFLKKHFADSLTITDFVKKNDKIIDVGTGGGFPGIPLKLNDDSLDVTLVDSVGKKVDVLNDIIQKLDIKNIEAIHTRAEDLANDNNYREKYDVAVSRAVASMSVLVEYLLPFVKKKGLAICMKGPNFMDELNQSMKAIDILGGKVVTIQTVILDDELERDIIVIKKEKSTPKKYPRSSGKIAKEPIS